MDATVKAPTVSLSKPYQTLTTKPNGLDDVADVDLAEGLQGMERYAQTGSWNDLTGAHRSFSKAYQTAPEGSVARNEIKSQITSINKSLQQVAEQQKGTKAGDMAEEALAVNKANMMSDALPLKSYDTKQVLKQAEKAGYDVQKARKSGMADDDIVEDIATSGLLQKNGLPLGTVSIDVKQITPALQAIKKSPNYNLLSASEKARLDKLLAADESTLSRLANTFIETNPISKGMKAVVGEGPTKAAAALMKDSKWLKTAGDFANSPMGLLIHWWVSSPSAALQTGYLAKRGLGRRSAAKQVPKMVSDMATRPTQEPRRIPLEFIPDNAAGMVDSLFNTPTAVSANARFAPGMLSGAQAEEQ
jgi:hypothetical protein